MTVDPADDCTFWYTTEYYDGTVPPPPSTTSPSHNWQTRIGSFKFPRCVGTVVNPLLLGSAVSRKTHGDQGSFDINLPLTGSPGVECRTSNPAGSQTLILAFTTPLTGVDSVSSSCGTAAGAIDPNDPFRYNVNITGCNANAQTVTVTLTGVHDNQGQTLASAAVPMMLLLGDTNGDGAVNSGDAQETRNRSGEVTNGANFRSDVNLDGTINSGDAFIVRRQSGTPQ